MFRNALRAGALCFAGLACAQATEFEMALKRSEEQLASSVGLWEVTTDFLNPDGSVAKSVSGSYEFKWVVPGRVVSGTSDLPELNQTSGILFYINAPLKQIEMVSVGGDGRLWVMTGDLGEEVRTTQEFKTASGGSGRLRFTRFNVKTDSFESRMDYTEDGGKTWQPGNRQSFRRARTGDSK